METLRQPGLVKNEILRIQSLISAIKIYHELLANHVNCRGIKSELVDMRKSMRGFQQESKALELDELRSELNNVMAAEKNSLRLCLKLRLYRNYWRWARSFS
jgi:hypothetical protein